MNIDKVVVLVIAALITLYMLNTLNPREQFVNKYGVTKVDTFIPVNNNISCTVPIVDPFDPSIRKYLSTNFMSPMCERHVDWLVTYDDGYLIWKNVCV
jgi:hypothetical protein